MSKLLLRAVKYWPVTVAVGGLTLALLASDWPPWANIARVEAAEKHLVKKIDDAKGSVEAIIVRGNLLGAYRACRQALQDKDMSSVYDSAAQISMLQADYVRLTGLLYPLGPCP